MAKRFIMTAFSKDRVGVVADITKVVYENGCNLEDTEMTRLEDEFVLMLLFTGDKEGIEESISKDCRRLEREKEISAYIRELPRQSPKSKVQMNTLSIYVEGLDQAGMVYKISNFLAQHSINILHLQSRRMPSPQSGTTLYTLEIKIYVPTEISMDDLEQKLSDLGQEMHITLNLNRI